MEIQNSFNITFVAHSHVLLVYLVNRAGYNGGSDFCLKVLFQFLLRWDIESCAPNTHVDLHVRRPFFCLVLTETGIRRRFSSASQMAINFCCCHQNWCGGVVQSIAEVPVSLIRPRPYWNIQRQHAGTFANGFHASALQLLAVPGGKTGHADRVTTRSGQTRIEFCIF